MNDGFRVGIDRSDSFLERSGEPIIPIFEAPMRVCFVNIIIVVVGLFIGFWAEPSIRVGSHVLKRGCRKEHVLILVENVPKVIVGAWVDEEGLAKSGVQEISKE